MHMSVSRRTLLALVPLALAGTSTAALAKTMSFNVNLMGAQQVPPVMTPGSGTAHLTYNTTTRVLTWSIRFSKLSSAATMAHFHNGAEGANGPVVIWLSTQGKTPTSPFSGKATLTPDQATQFLAGQWYINLHTKDHPAGEVRGQVVPPKA